MNNRLYWKWYVKHNYTGLDLSIYKVSKILGLPTQHEDVEVDAGEEQGELSEGGQEGQLTLGTQQLQHDTLALCNQDRRVHSDLRIDVDVDVDISKRVTAPIM